MGDSWVSVFEATCQELLAAALAEAGFQPARVEREPDWCSDFYVRQVSTGKPLYVRVSASWHVRDKPWQVGVSVGEGSIDWPEVDWNGLPLHILVEAHDAKRSPTRYSFASTTDLAGALRNVADELLRYGQTFLRGDLGEFKALRAEVNQTRSPYLIHRPDPVTGQYHAEPDQESAALKERYSSAQD